MAYTKHTWTTGEVITAGRLNNMEDGIAGGTLVIGGFSFNDNDALIGTSNKTWQEIDNALVAGVRCVVILDNAGGHVQMVVKETESIDGEYTITADPLVATTTSVDGYPSIAGPDDGGDIG